MLSSLPRNHASVLMGCARFGGQLLRRTHLQDHAQLCKSPTIIIQLRSSPGRLASPNPSQSQCHGDGAKAAVGTLVSATKTRARHTMHGRKLAMRPGNPLVGANPTRLELSQTPGGYPNRRSPEREQSQPPRRR